MAMIGISEAVATVIAPLLGGVLTQKLSWRWCFYINLPIGGLSLIVTALCMTDTSAKKTTNIKKVLGTLDLSSTAIFLPAIICLLLALEWGGSTWSWSNGRIIALLVLSAVLLAVWSWLQVRKGDSATVPLRIAKQRSIITGAIFAFALSGALILGEYFVSRVTTKLLNPAYQWLTK